MPPRSTNAPKFTTERHDTLAHLAGLQVREELVALLALGLLEVRAAGEHDVVAVLVELDDLALDRATDVRLQVAHAAQVDERRGQEAAQADVEDQPALDDLDDRAGDDAFFFLDLLDRPPGALVLRALLGEDQPTVLVLLLEDERLEHLVELHDLVRVDVVADRELLRRDDALGLEPDVEQHLVGVDLHDGAGDETTFVELDERGVDRVGQRHAAEVVEHDVVGAAVFGEVFRWPVSSAPVSVAGRRRRRSRWRSRCCGAGGAVSVATAPVSGASAGVAACSCSDKGKVS